MVLSADAWTIGKASLHGHRCPSCKTGTLACTERADYEIPALAVRPYFVWVNRCNFCGQELLTDFEYRRHEKLAAQLVEAVR